MTSAPAVAPPVVELVCAGCGHRAAPDAPYPVRCPAAVPGDDIDHVVVRRLDLARVRFAADDDPNPFVRHRELLRAYHVARAAGWPDGRFVAFVRDLDRAVAEVDGHGFRVTPLARADALSEQLGFVRPGGVWAKDETGNVSGSHKARHLFGALLELLVEEATGRLDAHDRPFAIASCGNAALAAAVVARAARRPLEVFVPSSADPVVLGRLRALGARVVVCERPPGAPPGDPTVEHLRRALDAGALPLTCQGDLNGLAIEGGQTLADEIALAWATDAATTGTAPDRVVVQVGGGALASAVAAGFDEARALGVLPDVPRLDTVQTQGAWPLARAYDAVAERLAASGLSVRGRRVDLADPRVAAILEEVARHRSAYMRPWEDAPKSVAHGILDDETYDWLAVVRAMLATGGAPVVVDEATLEQANHLGRETTGIDADHTGTSGLAGLVALVDRGAVHRTERVVVLFTGVRRTAHHPPAR